MSDDESAEIASQSGQDPRPDTNTEPMEDASEGAEPGRCNAITRDGTPCRKWPVGGAGEGRCRFHGGASTGPDDVSTLEGNDHAEGNAGGGAPEANANAEIHGGFADWRTAYERFDEDTRERVDRIAAEWRERAAETAPGVPESRRAELALEKAVLSVLHRRASDDVWCDLGGFGPGRGLTVERLNPAFRAEVAHSRRQRAIAEELRLWPGFQDDA